MTNVQVRARLQQTAIDLGVQGRDTAFGYGLLNVAAALGNGGATPIASAAIGGPTCLSTGGSYTYQGQATGGTAPYQYQWYRSMSPSGPWTYEGAGSAINLYFPGGSYGMYLKMRATDAVGTILESIIVVYMNGGASLQVADTNQNRRDMKLCGSGGGGRWRVAAARATLNACRVTSIRRMHSAACC